MWESTRSGTNSDISGLHYWVIIAPFSTSVKVHLVLSSPFSHSHSCLQIAKYIFKPALRWSSRIEQLRHQTTSIRHSTSSTSRKWSYARAHWASSRRRMTIWSKNKRAIRHHQHQHGYSIWCVMDFDSQPTLFFHIFSKTKPFKSTHRLHGWLKYPYIKHSLTSRKSSSTWQPESPSW